jgi:NADH-quinone oxidoreductase subunit I
MTDVYEFSEYERSNLVFNFATLTAAEAEEKKANYEKMMAEKEAAKAAAAKAKAEAAAKAKKEDKSSDKKDDNEKGSE